MKKWLLYTAALTASSLAMGASDWSFGLGALGGFDGLKPRESKVKVKITSPSPKAAFYTVYGAGTMGGTIVKRGMPLVWDAPGSAKEVTIADNPWKESAGPIKKGYDGFYETGYPSFSRMDDEGNVQFFKLSNPKDRSWPRFTVNPGTIAINYHPLKDLYSATITWQNGKVDRLRVTKY